jgi:hypothetical protein
MALLSTNRRRLVDLHFGINGNAVEEAGYVGTVWKTQQSAEGWS